MSSSAVFSTPRGPFAGAAPLALRPLSAIAATIAGGVPQGRIERIIAELLSTLDRLHQEGRICGDISVHSVGLDESGRAHLMALTTPENQADRKVLTPGYAPFELYTESSEWPRGPWTDIYALSAVVYSLVAGQRPPPAPERRIDDTYQPLTTLGLSKYSPAFLQAVDAGMELKPDDRPQTTQAYAERLALPLIGPPTESAAPAVTDPKEASVVASAQHAARNVSWRSLLRAILLGVATIAVAAYWWGRLTSQPESVITHSELVVDQPGRSASTDMTVSPSSPSSASAPSSGTPRVAEPVPDMPADNERPDSTSVPDTSLPEAEKGPAVDPTAATPPPAVLEPRTAGTPAQPTPVRVSINVRPWGEIVIDGVSRGVTPPLKTVMLRPGRHRVTIRNSAQPPHHMTLTVKAGKPAVITHIFR